MKREPERWRRDKTAAIADAQTRVKPSSWWTAHAAPTDRAGFVAAANLRNMERERRRFALTYRGHLS